MNSLSIVGTLQSVHYQRFHCILSTGDSEEELQEGGLPGVRLPGTGTRRGRGCLFSVYIYVEFPCRTELTDHSGLYIVFVFQGCRRLWVVAVGNSHFSTLLRHP